MVERFSEEYCKWVRLPDDIESGPLRVDRVRFQLGCNSDVLRGVHPIYPDDCPMCCKPVKVN